MKKYLWILVLCLCLALTIFIPRPAETIYIPVEPPEETPGDHSAGTEEPGQAADLPTEAEKPALVLPGNEELPTSEKGSGKVLVAYFSCVSQSHAGEIAQEIGADLHNILREQPYAGGQNEQDFCLTEKWDAEAHLPALADIPENFDSYHTLIIVYPLWWEPAPDILSDFMENCDLSEKTVIVHCVRDKSGLTPHEASTTNCSI